MSPEEITENGNKSPKDLLNIIIPIFMATSVLIIYLLYRKLKSNRNKPETFQSYIPNNDKKTGVEYCEITANNINNSTPNIKITKLPTSKISDEVIRENDLYTPYKPKNMEQEEYWEIVEPPTAEDTDAVSLKSNTYCVPSEIGVKVEKKENGNDSKNNLYFEAQGIGVKCSDLYAEPFDTRRDDDEKIEEHVYCEVSRPKENDEESETSQGDKELIITITILGSSVIIIVKFVNHLFIILSNRINNKKYHVGEGGTKWDT